MAFDYFSDTGLACLPDVGEVTYNEVTFSVLFHTHFTGEIIPDEAKRTRKVVGWTLYVEGVVTLDLEENTIDPTMDDLRFSLTEQGAALKFTGRGFGTLDLKPPPDVAWGPIPKLMEFTPYGQGRSAFIRWQVTVMQPEGPLLKNQWSYGQTFLLQPLQFSWDYALRYDDEGYSSYRITGILEIPLTRTVPAARAITTTVDDLRQAWLDMPVNLEKFRITERSFDVSKDKRTLKWVYACEELPPMGLPLGCTSARGTMSVRNRAGLMGGPEEGKLSFMFWTVSLRCTYTVRGDSDRRIAWLVFSSLLRFRMQQSRFAKIAPLNERDAAAAIDAAGARAAAAAALAATKPVAPAAAGSSVMSQIDTILTNAYTANRSVGAEKSKAALLIDFGFDEGLYLDSKTVTFHATWVLTGNWQNLLAATGFTRWLPGTAGTVGNLWRLTVADVMGWRSWSDNRLNAAADVIVDLGGGGPWGAVAPPANPVG
jgi:hypothetical protein